MPCDADTPLTLFLRRAAEKATDDTVRAWLVSLLRDGETAEAERPADDGKNPET